MKFTKKIKWSGTKEQLTDHISKRECVVLSH